MLSYAKNTEEEASSRYEGESSSLDLSDSDDNNDGDDETGAGTVTSAVSGVNAVATTSYPLTTKAIRFCFRMVLIT